MDRDRRPPPEFEDQFRLGRGQSYRPGGAPERSPLRGDTYRARSPPRHASFGDSYRGAPRPRSRSPPRRNEFRRRTPSPPRYRDGPGRDIRGGDSYRARPRSPPRRDDLGRNDLLRREPVRDFRDERPGLRDERNYPPRSPPPRFRDRSPLPLKRTREPSPISSRGRRTPPPAKRERLNSPLRPRYDDFPTSRGVTPTRRRPYSPGLRNASRDYAPHARSPLPRSDRVDPRSVDDWRRPRSPPRHDSIHEGRDSGATSRRSSPRPYQSRAAPIMQVDDRPSRSLPVRDDVRRVRSPEPRRREEPPPRERPLQEPDRPRQAEEQPRLEAKPAERPDLESSKTDEQAPPRQPPSVPARQYPPAASSAPVVGPTNPAAATPTATASIRTANAPPPTAPRSQGPPPSGPRSQSNHTAESGGRGGRGGYGSFRGGRGGVGGSLSRGESFQRENDFNMTPPTGPRSAAPPTAPRSSVPTGPAHGSSSGLYSRSQRFAPNGQPIPEAPTGPSSSGPPTGPRLQRRPTEALIEPKQSGPHPAIADLPKIIDGGQKAEPIVDMTRLNKLEDEAEKLRRALNERDAKKRKSLYEWDRLAHECEAAALKSELAEESLRKFNGEAEGQAAF